LKHDDLYWRKFQVLLQHVGWTSAKRSVMTHSSATSLRFMFETTTTTMGLPDPINSLCDPLPSHGGPCCANFEIWRYLSWIRVGTSELCPMWDIYRQPQNLSEDCGSRKGFFSDRQNDKMSQMSRTCPRHVPLGTFSVRIMDYGL